MITTTLNKILEHGPCGQDPNDDYGWWKLLNHLEKTKPDDEPLSLLTILESNGLDDAIWAAGAASRSASRSASRAEQKKEFIKLCKLGRRQTVRMFGVMKYENI